MKDEITQIAIRTLESGRVASAICIGFLFFISLFSKFGLYISEMSMVLGAPPLMISSAIVVVCYSAGVISTYVTTWSIKITCKAILLARHAISFLISIVKLKIKERNALNSALSQLTDNEREFLSLFRKTEISDQLNNNELLPFRVYIAGQYLVRKSILTCLKNNSSHERFNIIPNLKNRVERIVLNGSKMNNSVVLDLKFVQGNPASGCGAKAS